MSSGAMQGGARAAGGGKSITVVTSGHLATCPRMLKAADAFAEAGYRVRVLSTRFLPWADEADRVLRAERAEGGPSWRWQGLDFTWRRGPLLRLASSLRQRRATAAVRRRGTEGVSDAVAARAYARLHPELVRAIRAEPGDLIYGGTSGALAAVAEAARRTGVPYALDLEDLHGEELGAGSEADLHRRLSHRVLGAALPGAAFVTGGSAAIARAAAERYGRDVLPIHNTFPLPEEAPAFRPREAGAPLRLYWMSQTVGFGRGLEQVIEAALRCPAPVEIHLRGQATPAVLESLRGMAGGRVPVLHHAPEPPNRMVDLCRGYDVGLGTEPGSNLNNRLALTNKLLTYILAGMPIAMTNTPGQAPLGRDLGAGALVFEPGDVDSLARGLERWANHPEAHLEASRAAWEAARTRWHWEHPAERGALLAAVEGALRPVPEGRPR